MNQPFGDQIRVYIETGRRKTFAGAVDWPGWCRIGNDENSALQALFEIGLRYGGVLQAAQIQFNVPTELTKFVMPAIWSGWPGNSKYTLLKSRFMSLAGYGRLV